MFTKEEGELEKQMNKKQATSMKDVLLAQSTQKETHTFAKKFIDSLPFSMPGPREARFVVKVPGPGRQILLPLSKERFLQLKEVYGAENCIDKGAGFKDISNIYRKGKKK
jgi:hypothetical protein